MAQLLRGGLKRSSLPAWITVNDLIKHYCLDSQVLGDHNETSWSENVTSHCTHGMHTGMLVLPSLFTNLTHEELFLELRTVALLVTTVFK